MIDSSTRRPKATERVRLHVPEAYVVEIKPSARRSSRIVGEWVHETGPRREFDSKALAREWARTASVDGPVWVQDAAPHDPTPVDGYLVGGQRTRGSTSATGRQSSFDAV